ncbi:hypothetical protein EPICR_60144 [Candidatus Desulfarcum epimagneticum]|uniref:Uncharacterized protein n=1 Tax=uncultured Desulfobacteraceae bacterium TaxID=218296 RepID=A0A484HL59_9BACT|nr:hypothetical protein EPICR_60144 [uncultured Desulfobacteraceae bacterium]
MPLRPGGPKGNFENRKKDSVIFSVTVLRGKMSCRTGGYDERLIMIPYEVCGDRIRAVTVHAVTRQQINFRIKTRRLSNE